MSLPKDTAIVISKGVARVFKEKFAHNGYDMEYVKAQKLSEKTGWEIITDEEAEKPSEISIGTCERGYVKDFLSRMDINQYGICRKKNKIAVCGHSLAATVLAADMLEKLGTESITDGFCEIYTNNSWIADYPPFGGKIVSVTDCCFNGTEAVYSSGTEEYHEYLTVLEKNGYVKKYENSICGNLFRRYEKGDTALSLSHSPAEGYTRIISASITSTRFADILRAGKEELCDITVTQMALDYIGGSFGMGYIITLRDGSFVIIDGGHVRVKEGYPKTYDYVRLYTLLRELNKRPDGKIVISAWFITHEHSDHFNVFYHFCREYGSLVTLNAYCACHCSNAVAYNAQNPEFHSTNGRLTEALKNIDCKTVVTLRTGDDITLGGVRFEVLYTVDDLFPRRLYCFNDCSLVMKMTANGQSVMWLGDIFTAPSDILLKRYSPEYLKCDIACMAHHGLYGATEDLYNAIAPKVLLWSLWVRLAEKDLADDADTALRQVRVAKMLLKRESPPEVFYHTGTNYTLKMPYNSPEDLTKR